MLNQHVNLRTVYICVRNIVHNCRLQHSTAHIEKFLLFFILTSKHWRGGRQRLYPWKISHRSVAACSSLWAVWWQARYVGAYILVRAVTMHISWRVWMWGPPRGGGRVLFGVARAPYPSPCRATSGTDCWWKNCPFGYMLSVY